LEEDGCPVGVALITFKDVKTAIQAVEVFHGMKVPSSKDQVLWCRQLSGEGAQVKKNKIIIRNLPFNVKNKDWFLSFPEF